MPDERTIHIKISDDNANRLPGISDPFTIDGAVLYDASADGRGSRSSCTLREVIRPIEATVHVADETGASTIGHANQLTDGIIGRQVTGASGHLRDHWSVRVALVEAVDVFRPFDDAVGLHLSLQIVQCHAEYFIMSDRELAELPAAQGVLGDFQTFGKLDL